MDCSVYGYRNLDTMVSWPSGPLPLVIPFHTASRMEMEIESLTKVGKCFFSCLSLGVALFIPVPALQSV